MREYKKEYYDDTDEKAGSVLFFYLSFKERLLLTWNFSNKNCPIANDLKDQLVHMEIRRKKVFLLQVVLGQEMDMFGIL